MKVSFYEQGYYYRKKVGKWLECQLEIPVEMVGMSA